MVATCSKIRKEDNQATESKSKTPSKSKSKSITETNSKTKKQKLNEIDDIFNCTSSTSTPVTNTATLTTDTSTITSNNNKTKDSSLETLSSIAKKVSEAKKVLVVDASASYLNTMKNTLKSSDTFADSRGVLSTSRKTDDGLRLFTPMDLNIGKGNGDTELCPFDCDCCF
jgi:hypothetical protein